MKAVLSILSAAGTLASIAAIVVELIRWQARRPVRIAAAAAFLAVSIFIGIATLPDERPPGRQAENPAPPQPASITVIAETIEPQRIPSPATKAATIAKPAPRSEITLGDRERSMPEVVAAADDVLTFLQSRAHTVRGNLRGRQTEPDTSLQGLITTDLTLDVKLIDAQGAIRDAFTLTSRGGGFTAGESGLQARERLRQALHDRVKEQP